MRRAKNHADGNIVSRDENVVVLFTAQGERNGITFAGDGIQIWGVENGKAIRAWPWSTTLTHRRSTTQKNAGCNRP
jgi:hypothetical protein